MKREARLILDDGSVFGEIGHTLAAVEDQLA